MESSIQRIFGEALERESVEERVRYLDEACGADEELRRRVEKLLQAHEIAGSFLAEPGSNSNDEAGQITEGPGERIGRYKLLQQIGEGGCGVVYMAEQEEPVRRRVALKIIKLGMDTRSVIARFEAERQALAMMDHPNIAKVLDAGGTGTGRPYFVMELVRGVKITEYCQENRLSTEERLNLFVLVCKAVQHAHTKGVIHRDLKPGNILVSLHDGVPVPKVIDFGIAKATGQQRLTDKTVFTAFEQFIGTPAYMSPEQAEMSGLDVDTRSDIYSLGVLLYELLTGKPPFDNHELLTAGLDEMRRIIREVEPARPSSKLVAADVRRLQLSAARALNPEEKVRASSRRLLRSGAAAQSISEDLDWIVLKCLEKDRARRYETANALAVDVERHLRHEAVTARPRNAIYQFQKLVRRNRIAFASAAAVAAALVFGTGLSTWLYFRERAALRVAAENARAAGAQAQAARESAQREAQERFRSEMVQAELHFAQNDTSRGLAYLARLLRQQPTNRVVAQRIVSALTHRNFCIPITPPLRHGQPLRPWKGWSDRNTKRPFFAADSIQAAQFSPDGKLVLTGSRDGTAVLWESGTGLSKLSLRHAGELFWASFSPDGQRIITACRDHHAYIRSAATGELLAPPLRHDGPVTYAEFSPDGERVVTASEDGTAKVWRASTGEQIAGPLQHAYTIVTAHFSRDGRWIVTASYDYTARVWDAQTGEPRSPPLDQPNALLFAKFSPDGEKVVAGGWAGVVTIWNASSGDSLLHSAAHRANIQAALFTPTGDLLLTADNYDKVKFWDANTGQELPRLVQHGEAVLSLAISPDGKTFATGSGDTTARLWDVNSAQAVSEPLNHDSAVTQVSFSSDGQRLLTVSRNQALVWEIRARTSAALDLPQRAKRMRVGRFSPDGSKALIAGGAPRASLWDVQSGKLSGEFFTDSTYTTSAAFSSDGKLLVTASIGGVAKLWDLETKLPRASLRHSKGVAAVRFSPDGRLVFTSGGETRLWDASSGDLRFSLTQVTVPAADFGPDSKNIVLGLATGSAEIWDTGTGLKVRSALKHDAAVDFVQYSRDGSRILTASRDKSARIWNAQTGEILVSPLRHDDAVRSAEFSPDGALVLTVSGNAARLWDSRTGRPTTDLLRHGTRVNSARFSPDGRYIATSSDDGTARIWDSVTGFPVSEPLRHSSAVPSAEFSPDGKWVLTIDHSGSAKIWEAPIAAEVIPPWLPDLAEAFAGQRLTLGTEFEHVWLSQFWKRISSAKVREGNSYARWARWLFSSGASRTVSPFSSVTIDENLRRVQAGEHEERANGLFDSNRLAEAIAEYSKVLALTPDDHRTYANRGYAHEQLGQYLEAEADYRQALRLDPNDPVNHNLMACFYVVGPLQVRSPEKALPFALKSVELSNGYWNHLNSLGVVYYRMGQWRRAIETLEAAINANEAGGHAQDYYFMAMAYHQLGDVVRAEEFYRKGTEWQRTRSSSLSTEPWRLEVQRFQAEAAALLGKESSRP